jgi:hypothetical protein
MPEDGAGPFTLPRRGDGRGLGIEVGTVEGRSDGRTDGTALSRPRKAGCPSRADRSGVIDDVGALDRTDALLRTLPSCFGSATRWSEGKADGSRPRMTSCQPFRPDRQADGRLTLVSLLLQLLRVHVQVMEHRVHCVRTKQVGHVCAERTRDKAGAVMGAWECQQGNIRGYLGPGEVCARAIWRIGIGAGILGGGCGMRRVVRVEGVAVGPAWSWAVGR